MESPRHTQDESSRQRLVLFAAAYSIAWITAWYAAAVLASLGNVSLWFLPAGLRFFCLLMLGMRGLAVEAASQTAWVVLQLATGGENIHDPVSAQTGWQIYGWYVSLAANAIVALPLHRVMGDRWDFTRPRGIALFLAAALLASALAALAGSYRLVSLDIVTPSRWAEVLGHWMIGDFIGIITVAPLAIVRLWPSLRHYLVRGTWGRLRHAVDSEHRLSDAHTLLIAFVSLMALMGITGHTPLRAHFPLAALLLLLPLTGIALRSGIGSAVLAVVVLDTGLVLLIARSGTPDQALQYQLVMIAIASVGLWLGGAVEARNRLISRFRDFASVSNDLFWECDSDGNLLEASGRLATRLGAAPGSSWQHALASVARPQDLASLQRALDRKLPFRNLELELRGGDESGTRWVELNGLPLIDASGEMAGFRGTAIDTTSARRAEELLREYNERLLEEVNERTRSLRETVSELATKEQHLQVLLAGAPVGVIEFDEAGHCRYINANGCTLTGHSPEQATGRHLLDFVAPEDRDYVDFVWNVNRQSAEIKWLEFRTTCAGQRCVAHWINLIQADQPLRGTIVVLTDATALDQQNRRLWTLAHHDPLTGLPNRNLFSDRVEQALRQAKRQNREMALLWLDLDGFKAINDRLGHVAGDALLQRVAERLNSRARASDTVARMGGDEFAVVMADILGVEGATRMAQDLVDSLAEPFELPQGSARISASVGVALYPQHAASAETLAQRADMALYAAKQAGKNQVRLWVGG